MGILIEKLLCEFDNGNMAAVNEIINQIEKIQDGEIREDK